MQVVFIMSNVPGGVIAVKDKQFRALYAKYLAVDESTGRLRAREPDSTTGKADGPYEWHPEFGCEVPTYISPRKDLMVMEAVPDGTLQYHVPYCFRGPFRPEQWPEEYRNSLDVINVDDSGMVICYGQTPIKPRSKTMRPCRAYAVNRSLRCRNHGGALHPADRKISMKRDIKPDAEKVDNLSRVEKVILGIIPISELSDEEITNCYVINDDGKQVTSSRLGDVIQQKVTKELFRRMNQLMQSSLPSMIETMTKIASSDIVEPADRIKAAEFVINRVMGKAPEVVVHSVTDKPYEQVFDAIDGGSRDSFRQARAIESKRMDEPDNVSALVDRHINGDIEDAEIEDDDSDDLLEGLSDEEKAQYEKDMAEHREFLDENYVATKLGRDDSIESDGDASPELQVDPKPDYNYANRVAAEQKRIADEKKEAADRIKKSRNRRYAMRASGVSDMDLVPWLVDYGPYYELSMGRGKPKRQARHAKIILPDAQTPSVVDRVRQRNLEWEIERNSRLGIRED